MKSFLFWCVTFLLAGSVQAASFTFTGFYHEESDEWQPTASVWGYFESQDLNGDGIHERYEVSEFFIGDQRFIGGCGEASICGLFRFSWVPGGALDFHAGYGMLSPETGEAWADYSFETGFGQRSIWNTGGGWNSNTYSWRPETTVQICGVPDPGAYAMLALGLAVVGLRRMSDRRR